MSQTHSTVFILSELNVPHMELFEV